MPSAVPEAGAAELDRALLELVEQLLLATHPREIARSLLSAVVSTYGFPRGAVLGHVEGHLSCLAAHGLLEQQPGVGSSGAVERAQREGGPVVVPLLDADEEPWLARLLPHAADVLVVPMRAEDRPLGALVLQIPTVLRGAPGTLMLIEVQRAVANAELTLHRGQRLVQLQRLAATDDLTMIANRRSVLASLDRELARATRSGLPVSIVLLDLDSFKKVNDVHGHAAGDEALRNVAAALTIACRDLDTPARYGGEEFVVVLPDCDTERGVMISERLRAAVAAAPAVRPLTASAGVATFPVHAGDGEQLIRAADTALYKAKAHGRDQTVAFTGDLESEDDGGRSRPATTSTSEGIDDDSRPDGKRQRPV